MANEPTYSVKTPDEDNTVYTKTTTVQQEQEFTIAQLDAQIAQQEEVITQAQARITELEADKTASLATE